MIEATYRRDGNFVPITTLGLPAVKTLTFNGTTVGSVGTSTLFNITGTVGVTFFAVVEDNLLGSGTLEIGTAGSTAALATQRLATVLDQFHVWSGASSAHSGPISTSIHALEQNIIQTIGTNTVTAGTITYYCYWTPISNDGNVTAA